VALVLRLKNGGLALSGNANELAHGGGGPGKGSLSCLTVSPMFWRAVWPQGCAACWGVGTHQRPWNRIARREGWMAGIAPHFF
jgi:hypothetical protein